MNITPEFDREPWEVSMKKTERIEELLSHLAEEELDSGELVEIESFLESHPEERAELDFERAVMNKLRALPLEEVPRDFATQILAKAPPLPGGWLHRAELTLRRLLLPGLVTAGALAAFLVAVNPSPLAFDESGLGTPVASRSLQVASVMAGPGGLKLDRLLLEPGDQKVVLRGQKIQVPDGSSAHLQIADGVEVEIGGGTEVTLDSRIVFLEEGKVHVRVRPGIGNFVVHGPQASAWVVGTEFEVSALDGTSVQVTKGIVEVRAREGGQRTQLLAGGSARVDGAHPGKLLIQGPHQSANKPLQVATDHGDGPVEARVGNSGAQARNPEGLPDLDSN